MRRNERRHIAVPASQQNRRSPIIRLRQAESPIFLGDFDSECAELGAFGIKVPKKYGGLGLSQSNYGRAAVLLGSWDGNVAALVSAHQSIGVAQPLLLFGTEEQKQKYLPRVAGGEISAFALTETH